MNLSEILISPRDVCRRVGPHDRVVLTSRVRLARNIQGMPFPGHAKKPARVDILKRIQPTIESLDVMGDCFSKELGRLRPLDKQILVERHLISRELAAKGFGSALVLSADETFSVMINEEDHLRMQAILPGLQVKEAWRAINEVDSSLESKLDYAFSSRFGYLTACPTNVGTGIRVSAMLHLPGLVISEQINQIVTAVNKLGLAVRGLYGEGTDALGNVFQVSNQMTLGETEEEIVERLNKVLLQIIENEGNARAKLIETKPKTLFNSIGRAYGILTSAYIISSKEAKNLLSLLRLGLDLGYFPKTEPSLVDELFIVTEPAHIQYGVQRKKTADERDIMRADLLRDRLSQLPRPEMTLPPGVEPPAASDPAGESEPEGDGD